MRFTFRAASQPLQVVQNHLLQALSHSLSRLAGALRKLLDSVMRMANFVGCKGAAGAQRRTRCWWRYADLAAWHTFCNPALIRLAATCPYNFLVRPAPA